MTTTPNFWKSFTGNVNALSGVQGASQTTGLANGNILVTWGDFANGPSAGGDIMGQIFDPEGNPLGAAFQVNTRSQAQEELFHQIAAMPDGGFVIAYVRGGDSDIFVERHAANGGVLFTDTISDAAAGFGFSIAASLNGDYVLNFGRNVGGLGPFPGWDPDVFGVIYNGTTNLKGPVFEAAKNSGNGEYIGDVSALVGGGYVTVYDIPVTGRVEYRIVDDNGVRRVGGTDVGAGQGASVAALNNGNFVVAYENNGDILYRVISPEGGASPVLVAADGANSQGAAVITALKDGGFFIAWGDNTGGLVAGRRYEASGDPVGDIVIIAGGLESGYTGSRVATTADGRILVTFTNAAKEIGEVILDPRDSLINGTSGNDVLTTKIVATTVFAGGGHDRVFGQSGNDTINGGDGNDTLRGGSGIDTVNGDAGNDVIEILEGQNSDNVHGGADFDTLNLNAITSRSASINLASGTWSLSPGFPVVIPGTKGGGTVTLQGSDHRSISGIEKVSGTRLGDSIIGSSAGETLRGEQGNDILNGGAGNDTLFGGEGNDIVTGGLGKDIMSGFTGSDIFDFNAVADSAINSALNDLILDFNANAADIIDLSGIDAIDGGGNDAFSFIGTNAFSAAGQVRVVFFNGNTLIDMNTGGSLAPDSRIVLAGTVQLDAADFIL